MTVPLEDDMEAIENLTQDGVSVAERIRNQIAIMDADYQALSVLFGHVRQEIFAITLLSSSDEIIARIAALNNRIQKDIAS